MNDDLDVMLLRPLEEPDDAAFSTRVLARIGRRGAFDESLDIAALVLAACSTLALLSLTGAGHAVAQSASQLAYSAPFALGVTLLFLPRILLDAMPE
ncbi:MAG: hypothetical protein ABSA49_01400 [Rhizomicrobium sp.]|jgi:hypothetical protein